MSDPENPEIMAPERKFPQISWPSLAGFVLTLLLALLMIPLVLESYPLVMLSHPFRWPFDILLFLFKPFLSIRPWLLLGHWKIIVFLGFLALLAQASGRKILGICMSEKDSQDCFSGFALPVGLGLFGLLAAFLCWAHLFNRLAFIFLGMVILITCHDVIRVDFIRFKNWIRSHFQHRPIFCWKSLITLSGWCLLFFLLGLSLIYSFAPPHQSDAIRYHLSVPKLYALHGGYVHLPYSAFSNFPFTVEMLYGIALLFPGGVAARGIHWLYLLALTRALYVTGKRYGNTGSGLLSALLFVSIPFVPLLASWAFIEIALTIMVFLSCYALLLWAESREWIKADCPRPDERAARILLILCLGITLGIKYTSIFSCAFLFLCALAMARRVLRHSLKPILVVFLLGGFLASPWYIKNLIVTGNPVYPLANSQFRATHWSEAEAALYYYHAGMKGSLNWVKSEATPTERLGDFISLPFRAIAANGSKPVIWQTGSFRLLMLSPEGFGNWPLGWGPLFLIPLLLCIKRHRSSLVWLFINSLLLYLFWAYTYRDNRFLLPALAVLCPALAVAVRDSLNQGRIIQFGVILLVTFAIIYGALSGLQTAFTERNVLPVVNGLESEDDFLKKQQNSYEAMQWLKEKATGKVILDGDHRTYYADFDYIASDFFNAPVLWQWARECSSVDDLEKRVRANAEWILINDVESGLIRNGFPLYRAHFLPIPDAVSLVKMASQVNSEQEFTSFNRILTTSVDASPAYQRYREFLETRLETVKTLNGSRICRLRSETTRD